MKKRVLLLLPLFLGACSDSGESPVITIERLYVILVRTVRILKGKTILIRKIICRL